MNDPASDEIIAAWMRRRGDVQPPPGLLAAARERALHAPSPRGRLFGGLRPAIGWAAAAVALVLVAAAVVPAARHDAPVSAPSAPSVPLLAVVEQGGLLQLVRSDAATGRPLAEADGIPAGHHFQTALSPDGRRLALITWPRDDVSAGDLSIVDLVAWSTETAPMQVGPDVSALTWSHDATQLLWFAPTRAAGPYSIPRAYTLLRWTLGTAGVEPVLTLDDAFMPRASAVLAPSSLLVYGQPVDEEYLASDVPHVLRIDLVSGTLAADRPLEGVTAGQRLDEGGDAGVYIHDEPAVTWDLPRSRLLVAEHDQLTRVDLTGELSASTFPIRARTSLLGGLLALLVPAASAKSPLPGETLRAALSPDGERLYLTGSVVRRTPGGSVREPLGLRVVDPADGALLATLEGPLDQVALSADGRTLVVSGSLETFPPDGEEASTIEVGDLRIVEADGLREVARLPAPAGPSMRTIAGVSWDGRHAYVLTHRPRTGGWLPALEVVDTATAEVVSVAADTGARVVDVVPLS